MEVTETTGQLKTPQKLLAGSPLIVFTGIATITLLKYSPNKMSKPGVEGEYW